MPKKVKKISSESMFHQIARKECESHRALTGTNITFQPLIEGEAPGMALKYRMFCPYCAIAPDGMSAQATYQATVMDTKDGRLFLQVSYTIYSEFKEKLTQDEMGSMESFMMARVYPYCRTTLELLLSECGMEKKDISRILPPVGLIAIRQNGEVLSAQ